jgi:hypothetical protein
MGIINYEVSHYTAFFFPFFSPSQHNYSSQYSVLKPRQLWFVSVAKWPSSTPCKVKNRTMAVSYVNLYVFNYEIERKAIRY